METPKTEMFLYENMQTLRLIHRYSQEYLAAVLEVSQPYYSKIEHGEKDLSISKVLKISKLYEIPIQVLIERDLAKESDLNSRKNWQKNPSATSDQSATSKVYPSINQDSIQTLPR